MDQRLRRNRLAPLNIRNRLNRIGAFLPQSWAGAPQMLIANQETTSYERGSRRPPVLRSCNLLKILAPGGLNGYPPARPSTPSTPTTPSSITIWTR